MPTKDREKVREDGEWQQQALTSEKLVACDLIRLKLFD